MGFENGQADDSDDEIVGARVCGGCTGTESGSLSRHRAKLGCSKGRGANSADGVLALFDPFFVIVGHTERSTAKGCGTNIREFWPALWAGCGR